MSNAVDTNTCILERFRYRYPATLALSPALHAFAGFALQERLSTTVNASAIYGAFWGALVEPIARVAWLCVANDQMREDEQGHVKIFLSCCAPFAAAAISWGITNALVEKTVTYPVALATTGTGIALGIGTALGVACVAAAVLNFFENVSRAMGRGEEKGQRAAQDLPIAPPVELEMEQELEEGVVDHSSGGETQVEGEGYSNTR